MELSRIAIKNFRSIKEAYIKFNHNCMVLLGKNEAGKSNVLKAVAAVFEKYNVTNKDKRKRIENEKIEEYYIRAILTINENDIKNTIQKFEKKYVNAGIIKFKNDKTFYEYIRSVFYELIIQINVADGAKQTLSFWAYNKTDFDLSKPVYLNNNKITHEISGGVELNLKGIVFGIIKEVYNEQKYDCNYWQYNDNFLLPHSVNIDDFIQNPSSVKGLENIFQLCKRENIKKEFEDALAEDGDYANLLEQVAKHTTMTFQKIWKDFKGTSIQLQQNGDEILIKVKDKANYSFEDRSDGFKKFISILLMISSQSRSNKIHEKIIIVIDEPDQSLYPTSAQFLRDELLEISKKSKVIFSTHSQYMIDPVILDRHIIVEKIEDITYLKIEDINAPFSTDELLKRAIGSGIFECLQPKNILFEGYLDKELFLKFNKFHKKENLFKAYGTVYLGGISGVETLVQLLVLANKKFVIVADSDETSNHKKGEFYKNYHEYKNSWIGYKDICKEITTMEDFLVTDYVIEQMKTSGVTDYEYDDSKNVITNIEKAVKNNKEEKQALKNKLVANLTKENIKLVYEDYINKTIEIIEAL